MAFTLANLVRVYSVTSGLNDATTTTSDGFGGTVTRQTEPHTKWAYAENATLATIIGSGYMAAAGSTSGTGQLKVGDLIEVYGNNGSSIYWVDDAATPTLHVLGA